MEEKDNFYKKDIETIYKILQSKETGLSEEQVNNWLKSNKKNMLSKLPEKSFLTRVIVALSEPMVRVLIFAIFLTILINIISIIEHQEPDWGQTTGIIFSVILATTVTVFMEKKSQDAFSALKKIGDKGSIKVLRDNKVCIISIEYIFPGDIIFINTGDKIPADGRIIECFDLSIDESMLTGESMVVKKIHESLQGERFSLSERLNMVYSGTFVIDGTAKIIITAIGDETEIGKISQSIQIEYNILTPLQKELGSLGKKIATVGIIISIIVFCLKIFNYHVDNELTLSNVAQAITICLVLIVSTIPEGLPTMIAATLALGVMRLSKDNALVKKLAVCESIGAIDIICSDKTGTLTENKMSVTNIISLRKELIFENIYFNNTISTKQDLNNKIEFIGNPTEVALLNFYQDNFKEKNFEDKKVIHQYPFSSTKKSMGTVVKSNFENLHYLFFLKGAPEKILETASISIKEKEKQMELIIHEQNLGRRVLAFSHRVFNQEEDWKEDELNLLRNFIYDGFISISDPIRKEVFQAIDICQKANIDIKILTGDSMLTANAIANELGLIKEKSLVLEAREIDKMTEYELKGKLKNIVVIGRSNPLTKLRIVNALMESGKSVAVTGDGINDAPSLKRAEVGIAMGIAGTEVSKETADIVLLNDSFATIVKAIESGRGLYENFQKFIQFQQTVNVGALFLILIFELLDWGTPLKPIQILWINIMMDGPLAISLSFEKTRKHIMDEPPRDKSKSIMTGDLWINILANALFMVLVIIFFVRVFHISREMIPTYTFNLFGFLVTLNVYNCKSINKKSIISNIFDNKTLNIIFLITILIQLIIVLFLRQFFSISILTMKEYISIFAFGFLIIIFSEFLKFWRRILNK
ncbi:calcium-translocating P-type ATPase, PMCA-type [Candidatus Cetobacterium colombiensis]|uniref:P-type Ca(2+) transporter n=1 Tax=Candidatus Cetobacterium colombiensis TaxID=3073100 RepID=A0ABU4WBJ2_9FUSO|nr:calcium-translocating P-type ATPase, PMCA-type [Candidatus Cetobacterium colombiensis]MDX8336913.1 calcium-translocating P-type ATPase, PMCA-type [Candidatus Cetobacterium colombiensis]